MKRWILSPPQRGRWRPVNRDLKQRNANDDGNAYLHSISENFISNAVSLRGCQDSFFCCLGVFNNGFTITIDNRNHRYIYLCYELMRVVRWTCFAYRKTIFMCFVCLFLYFTVINEMEGNYTLPSSFTLRCLRSLMRSRNDDKREGIRNAVFTNIIMRHYGNYYNGENSRNTSL